ncbi:MAG: BatD family protein [Candidatus Eisenbacteria bacterium]
MQAVRLVLVLLLFGARVALAEVTLRAEIEPSAVEVGEAAGLTVTVEGASRINARPIVPAVPGLDIQSRGQSSNLSIVNGRMSQSISFQYAVFATKAGSYTIGPIELKDGNHVYRADAVSFSVVRAGAPAPGGGPPQAPADDESSFAAGALFVRGVVDKDRVVLGEQVTLRFQFWKRADVPPSTSRSTHRRRRQASGARICRRSAPAHALCRGSRTR